MFSGVRFNPLLPEVLKPSPWSKVFPASLLYQCTRKNQAGSLSQLRSGGEAPPRRGEAASPGRGDTFAGRGWVPEVQETRNLLFESVLFAYPLCLFCHYMIYMNHSKSAIDFNLLNQSLLHQGGEDPSWRGEAPPGRGDTLQKSQGTKGSREIQKKISKVITRISSFGVHALPLSKMVILWLWLNPQSISSCRIEVVCGKEEKLRLQEEERLRKEEETRLQEEGGSQRFKKPEIFFLSLCCLHIHYVYFVTIWSIWIIQNPPLILISWIKAFCTKEERIRLEEERLRQEEETRCRSPRVPRDQGKYKKRYQKSSPEYLHSGSMLCLSQRWWFCDYMTKSTISFKLSNWSCLREGGEAPPPRGGEAPPARGDMFAEGGWISRVPEVQETWPEICIWVPA